MDQVKIGKFIAELRRRAGLTQEALGEKNWSYQQNHLPLGKRRLYAEH